MSGLEATSNVYKAVVLEEDWEEIKNSYTDENYLTLSFPMTVNKDNAIHMAVYSNREQPLRHFLDIVHDSGDSEIAEIIVSRNVLGNTPLHKAAFVGNYEAAKLLVQKRRKLLEMKNKQGETPLFTAVARGHTKVMKYLASQTGQTTSDKKLEKIHRYRETSDGKIGDSILQVAIQGEHFGTGLALLDLDETLAKDNDNCEMSCLQLLASKPHAFKSAYKMGFWKSILYYCLPDFDDVEVHKLDKIQERPKDLESGAPVGDQCLDEVENIIDDDGDSGKASKTVRFLRFLFQELPNMGKLWSQKRAHKFAFKLAKLLIKEDRSWEQSNTEEQSRNVEHTKEGGGGHPEKLEDQKSTANKQDKQAPAETNKLEETPESPGQPAGGEIALLMAARNGIIEIVKEMLHVHPQAIEHYSHKRQNILHVTVLHRQKKIFDVAKKMRIPMTDLVEGIDENGYSILHCAADKTHYSEGARPGAAYQLQDEIKWSNRVYKLVPPHFGLHRDKNKMTAKELFEQQHKDQLKEAQRWIKETAQSCSTVAVLVATVVFAAAYTVPGGSNERGLPNFLDSPIFLFFTIMDVVSLAGSLTAVVTFLSILTSPFEFSNFYKTLPRRLTFGFTMLFLSVTTTMMAFTATILLVIRLEPRRWTSTLVYTAAFFPVGILALTQFPLYVSFVDNLMKISKAIKKIIPLNLVRRQFTTRGRSTKKNGELCMP